MTQSPHVTFLLDGRSIDLAYVREHVEHCKAQINAWLHLQVVRAHRNDEQIDANSIADFDFGITPEGAVVVVVTDQHGRKYRAESPPRHC